MNTDNETLELLSDLRKALTPWAILFAELFVIFLAFVFLFAVGYYSEPGCLQKNAVTETVSEVRAGGYRLALERDVESEITFSDCLYFSFVTITTLGYGDITPVGEGRWVASFEVVFGLLFVGISINRIYSLAAKSASIRNDAMYVENVVERYFDESFEFLLDLKYRVRSMIAMVRNGEPVSVPENPINEETASLIKAIKDIRRPRIENVEAFTRLFEAIEQRCPDELVWFLFESIAACASKDEFSAYILGRSDVIRTEFGLIKYDCTPENLLDAVSKFVNERLMSEYDQQRKLWLDCRCPL